MNKKIKRRIIKGGLLISTLLLLVFFLFIYANWIIPHKTTQFIYNNADSIPSQKVALVLGTSKYISKGHLNPFFAYRMLAAKELYEAGKVKAFVVSGDNGTQSYNEPRDMRKALLGMGIPDSIIYLDYAGFRTLDSVVRMNEIFGQDSFIVVSQEFHNERAIFLAQQYGMIAYGYNAKDVEKSRLSYRTMTREKFARVKVFVDILLNKQPKFLGEPVIIKQ